MSSIVTCPHCQGMGYRHDDQLCGLCGKHYKGWAMCRGWLELPVTHEQATYIYENSDSSDTEDLVCQTWDREGDHWCRACDLKGHQCLDCYQMECEGQEREYSVKVRHDC